MPVSDSQPVSVGDLKEVMGQIEPRISDLEERPGGGVVLFDSVGNTNATVTLRDSTDNYSRFDITTKEESAYGVSVATTTVSRSWSQRGMRIPVITYDGRVNVCGLTISGDQITISGVVGYIVMVVGYKS